MNQIRQTASGGGLIKTDLILKQSNTNLNLILCSTKFMCIVNNQDTLSTFHHHSGKQEGKCSLKSKQKTKQNENKQKRSVTHTHTH